MDEILLDVSGLRCPMPVLKARRALEKMQPGQVLKVIATDPAAEKDMPPFCEMKGYRLIESYRDGESYVFVIRR